MKKNPRNFDFWCVTFSNSTLDELRTATLYKNCNLSNTKEIANDLVATTPSKFLINLRNKFGGQGYFYFFDEDLTSENLNRCKTNIITTSHASSRKK